MCNHLQNTLIMLKNDNLFEGLKLLFILIEITFRIMIIAVYDDGYYSCQVNTNHCSSYNAYKSYLDQQYNPKNIVDISLLYTLYSSPSYNLRHDPISKVNLIPLFHGSYPYIYRPSNENRCYV